MVCDGALVVNLVASAMMNGVCCLHNVHEEEDRRKQHQDTLQKAIKVEWQRQRLLDKQAREQEQATQNRRRSLMLAKLRAQQEGSRSSSSSDTSRAQSSSMPPMHCRSMLVSPSTVMSQRRVRSEPMDEIMRQQHERHRSGLSSLFDNEDEDDDDSLEDVALI